MSTLSKSIPSGESVSSYVPPRDIPTGCPALPAGKIPLISPLVMLRVVPYGSSTYHSPMLVRASYPV